MGLELSIFPDQSIVFGITVWRDRMLLDCQIVKTERSCGVQLRLSDIFVVLPRWVETTEKEQGDAVNQVAIGEYEKYEYWGGGGKKTHHALSKRTYQEMIQNTRMVFARLELPCIAIAVGSDYERGVRGMEHLLALKPDWKKLPREMEVLERSLFVALKSGFLPDQRLKRIVTPIKLPRELTQEDAKLLTILEEDVGSFLRDRNKESTIKDKLNRVESLLEIIRYLALSVEPGGKTSQRIARCNAITLSHHKQLLERYKIETSDRAREIQVYGLMQRLEKLEEAKG